MCIPFFWFVWAGHMGNKRFNFEIAFDFVLIIIIGAVLSPTINGPFTLLEAMAGSTLLIFLDWLFRYRSFSLQRIWSFDKREIHYPN